MALGVCAGRSMASRAPTPNRTGMLEASARLRGLCGGAMKVSGAYRVSHFGERERFQARIAVLGERGE
eukprot:3516796-Pleurochrysis_carterae.AAC.1